MLSYLPQIINRKTVINMTSTYAAGDLMCQNGDIRIRPGTIGIVDMCVSGVWRTLCPNEYFWGSPQAAVACRQLKPGKKVIGNLKC